MDLIVETGLMRGMEAGLMRGMDLMAETVNSREWDGAGNGSEEKVK